MRVSEIRVKRIRVNQGLGLILILESIKQDFDLNKVLTSFAIENRKTVHSKAFMCVIFMPTLLLSFSKDSRDVWFELKRKS